MDISSIKPFGQQIQAMAKQKPVEGYKNFGEYVSEQAHLKKTAEAPVSESTEVSLNSGNEPLSFVLKATLENVNAALEEATGQENAIETVIGDGIDYSPEVTANSIVNQITPLLATYLETSTETEQGDSKADFFEIIKSGIEEGFSEAKNYLEGLGILEDEVASNIGLAYDLVQSGLDAILNSENLAVDKPVLT